MARILVVALALLALAGTASAEFFEEEVWDKHPFQAVSQDVWLPILKETGDVHAAEAAAVKEIETQYGFMPLGDADRDGVEDVVRITVEYDDDDVDVLLEALSGADLETILWDYEIRRGFAYMGGDYDNNGVRELVTGTTDSREKYQNTGNGYYFELTGETEYEVLDGRTGKTMFEVDAPFLAYMERSGSNIIIAGDEQQRYIVEYSGLADLLSDEPGADLLHYRVEESSNFDYFILLYSNYDAEFVFSTGVARYDLEGNELFQAATPEDSVGFLTDIKDVTGDGFTDYLFSYRAPYHTSYSYQLMGGGSERPGAAPHTVFLADGATGERVWEVETEPVEGDAYATFIGDLYGEGQNIAVNAIDYDKQSTAITFYDMDGHELDSFDENQFLFVLEHGDVDGDGMDEVGLIETDDLEEGRVGVADAELQYLWSRHVDEDDYAYFLGIDFDGDGINDVGTEDDKDNEIGVLSGTDGQRLWTYELDDDIVSGDFIESIGADEGWDLLLLRFPDADEDTEEYADMEGYLELYQGHNMELVWTKLAYQPDYHDDVTATNPFLRALAVDDLSGDRGRDLLITIGSFEDYSYSMSCTSGPFGSSCHVEEDGPDGAPLDIDMIVAGATGQTLLRYNDIPTEDLSEDEMASLNGANVTEAGVELQSSLSGGLTPFGLSILLVGSIVGAVAVGYMVRKKATADA